MMIRIVDAATVTLYIGLNKAPALVHKDILCNASKVFQTAFQSQFKEGQEQTMNLPDDDPDLFDIFIQCLYRGTYSNPESEAVEDEPIRLYILAEKYQVRLLKNSIIDLYYLAAKNHSKSPSFAMLEKAYAQTSPKCGLRKFFADWHIWGPKHDLQIQDSSTQDFLRRQPDITIDFLVSLHDKWRYRYIGSKPLASVANYHDAI